MSALTANVEFGAIALVAWKNESKKDYAPKETKHGIVVAFSIDFGGNLVCL